MLAFSVVASAAHAGEAASSVAPPSDGQARREVSLDEAIELALEHSPVIAEARSKVADAVASRVSAYGSLLPTVHASYGYLRSNQPQLDPTGRSITTSGWGAELMASFDPVTAFIGLVSLRAARNVSDAEKAGLVEARARTVLAVKEAYFRAVASRILIRLQRNRLSRQTSQLDFINARLAQGRVGKMELLRSEIDRNNAEVALARAESAFVGDAEHLGVVVGLDQPLYPEASAELGTTKISMSRNELIAVARRDSAALQGARARVAAAEEQLSAARLEYLPRIALSAGWGWQGDSFPPREPGWRFMASGTYPLLDGLQTAAAVRRATAALDAARASQRDVELSIVSTVGAQYDRCATELRAVQVGEQTAELAREELVMQQERLRLGRGSILEIQTAQVALQQAELDLLNARVRYELAVARLELATGLKSGDLASGIAAPDH